jgi:hypothetical protein
VTPATLSAGNYAWTVKSANAAGGGPWGAYVYFTVQPPPAPAPTAPTGNITTGSPAFTWNAVAGATQYVVLVRTEAGESVSFADFLFFSAASVCSGTTCSVTPGALAAGTYFWRIQSGNATGTGSWSAYTFFTVQPPPPPSTVSPAGYISTPSPVFTWNKVTGATSYTIVVRTEDGALASYPDFLSYSAASVCSGTTCSVTPGTLAAGTYFWRIQSINATGSGPWSGYVFFTVTPPPAPTQVSPSGGISTYWPAFRWNAVSGATTYVLRVMTADGTPVTDPDYLYFSAASICSGGVCSVAPAWIGSGSYFWVVQSANAAGGGPWSGFMWFSH